MMRTLYHIILTIVIIIIVYILFAFILLVYDPLDWSESSRIAFVFTLICFQFPHIFLHNHLEFEE